MSSVIHWDNKTAIYLHVDPVDFRKSINGLSLIVEDEMALSSISGSLFVFCNKKRDKLKALYWDESGFALWYKRLEKEKFKGKIGKADQAIAFIQKLYTIEKHIKELAPDKRYEIRQKESKPIVDKIKIWMDKSIANVPPKMALGKALYYLHEQWPRLIGYLDDGCYPIDNNLAENAIRPFTLGRKNWLFSNSQAGAKASANLFSLTETAKANGINPYDYLKVSAH
jgi:hypothetical protein